MKVKHLIFDMDDTLYPPCGAMHKGINQRIISGVAEFFGISVEEAAADLKLRVSQIEDLEAGNKDSFSDIFYLK